MTAHAPSYCPNHCLAVRQEPSSCTVSEFREALQFQKHLQSSGRIRDLEIASSTTFICASLAHLRCSTHIEVTMPTHPGVLPPGPVGGANEWHCGSTRLSSRPGPRVSDLLWQVPSLLVRWRCPARGPWSFRRWIAADNFWGAAVLKGHASAAVLSCLHS